MRLKKIILAKWNGILQIALNSISAGGSMKWIAARIEIVSDQPAFAIELVSNVFYRLGLQGVSIDGPMEEPEEGWGEGAVSLSDQPAVTGYFPLDERFEAQRLSLEEALGKLTAEWGVQTRILYEQMDEEDWAESWKAYFWPEKITDRIVVKPTWREYEAREGELVLEIDPGMAFGTGTHPTTALCIRMIQSHLHSGDAFLDVGTGSGILMIAAAKLGAGKVVGIDNDPVAVAVAQKNLHLNGVGEDRFRVAAGDLLAGTAARFDLVVANILSEAILILAESVRRVLSPGGIFICSGIVEENAQKVVEKLIGLNFEILERETRESWTAIVARKETRSF